MVDGRRPAVGRGQARHELRPRGQPRPRVRDLHAAHLDRGRVLHFAARAAEAQLRHAGLDAGDFHVHAQPSTDSGLPIADRVTSCAAEGLEVAVATDHNYITDYSPVIANLSLDEWLLGVPGMELTTFEMGHFIGYPLKVDPGSTRGGESCGPSSRPRACSRSCAGSRSIQRSDEIRRHGRASAPAGARLLVAVLRRPDHGRAVHADRHHGRVRAVRRRVRRVELQLRLRRGRARSPAAGSRMSTRSSRRTRCRPDRFRIRSLCRASRSSARMVARSFRASSRRG